MRGGSTAGAMNRLRSYLSRMNCSTALHKGGHEYRVLENKRKRIALIIVLVWTSKAIWNICLVEPLRNAVPERLEELEKKNRRGYIKVERVFKRKKEKKSTKSCSSVHLSRFTDLTLDICVPRFLWIPEQRIHTKTPKFVEAHRGPSRTSDRAQRRKKKRGGGFDDSPLAPQSAQNLFSGCLSISSRMRCCIPAGASFFAMSAAKLVSFWKRSQPFTFRTLHTLFSLNKELKI